MRFCPVLIARPVVDGGPLARHRQNESQKHDKHFLQSLRVHDDPNVEWRNERVRSKVLSYVSSCMLPTLLCVHCVDVCACVCVVCPCMAIYISIYTRVRIHLRTCVRVCVDACAIATERLTLTAVCVPCGDGSGDAGELGCPHAVHL